MIQSIIFHDQTPRTSDNLTVGRPASPSPSFLSDGNKIVLKVVDLPETNVILERLSPAPFDEGLFHGCSAVIFVVDITADYVDALTKLCALVMRSRLANARIPFEVLLHKADSLDEVDRVDVQRDITQKVNEELHELCSHDPPQIHFHVTSIYDSSLYISLSRIMARHLAIAPALESLLDTLCNNAKIEKAFLFDLSRRIFIASDSSPLGTRSFDLGVESLDMLLDLASLYVHHRGSSTISSSSSNAEKVGATHGEIALSNGITVTYHQINRYLCLILLAKSPDNSSISKPDLLSTHLPATKEAILKLVAPLNK